MSKVHDAQPLTVDEQARIDALRAQLGELPDGVSIDFSFRDPQEMAAEVAATDAAVFVTGRNFGTWNTDHGPIPACEIDIPWLEQLVAEGDVTCSYYGIGNAIEDVPMPTFVHFRLSVAPLYITIADAGEAFIDQAMNEGIAAVFPARPDGRRVYIAAGAMKRFDTPTQVDPKVGRNDPCPCGSGLKFKRCHA